MYIQYENVKAGDELLIDHHGNWSKPFFAEVIRTTKTQLVVTPADGSGGAMRFMRSTGKRVGDGDGWYGFSIKQVSNPEFKAKYLAEQENRRLHSEAVSEVDDLLYRLKQFSVYRGDRSPVRFHTFDELIEIKTQAALLVRLIENEEVQ